MEQRTFLLSIRPKYQAHLLSFTDEKRRSRLQFSGGKIADFSSLAKLPAAGERRGRIETKK